MADVNRSNLHGDTTMMGHRQGDAMGIAELGVHAYFSATELELLVDFLG